jgi:hypothetical protein
MAHGRCRRQGWIVEGTSDSISDAQLTAAMSRPESSCAQKIATKISPWNAASWASITEAEATKSVAFDGSLVAQ